MWLHVPDSQPEISPDDITVLSFCSGVAMLDEGVKAGLEHVTGRRSVSVGYCERDAYAASTLVARMEDEVLTENTDV